MYSEKIIVASIEEFASRENWMPVYHSYDEVLEFTEYIKSLTKVESNSKNSYLTVTKQITAKRAAEIKHWIENEQCLCALDANYWETRYAWVCSEKGDIYKYQPRLSQRILDTLIAEFDEKQVSIELLILKGRQLGVTSWTALKFIRRLLFVPHTQAVMASVKAAASELIERILNTAYNHCPWWLVPRKQPKRAFDNGSVLSIQSGMQATGLAQGWTPVAIHVSELADIPNAKRTIEEGLFRATHSSKNLFMVLEGTGGGSTGWLADTWRASKEDWPKGRSRLCPVFVPWPMCPEIYPQPDWVRKFPVPENFMSKRAEATRKHVARAESYIRNTPYLSKVTGNNYRMPVEQQWYWEFNYLAAIKNHTQKTWLAQMPCDDFEALTGVHDSVFDSEIMADIEDEIYEVRGTEKTRKQPVQAYAITGHDIDDAFYPDDSSIDWDQPQIKVSWRSHRGQTYHWEMIPLLPLSEEEEVNTMDRVLIYEEPQKGCQYTFGIDTADGLGKEDEDRTVLSGTKNLFHGECDEQIFELTSSKINAAQAVAFAACLGAYYGPCCPDPRGVMFAIEQIGRPGETCQHQLKMMGFTNHYRPKRFDSKKIRDESRSKEGWWSSSWSVPILMTRFVEAVNGGWYQPKSRWLIEELKTLERHVTSGKSKMEHRSGQHDDRVRAAAQSYFCAHDMDILVERAQKRYNLPEKKGHKAKGVCTANCVNVGEWE